MTSVMMFQAVAPAYCNVVYLCELKNITFRSLPCIIMTKKCQGLIKIVKKERRNFVNRFMRKIKQL